MCCILLKVGLDAARALDDKVCWERLADAALAHGNHQVSNLSDLESTTTHFNGLGSGLRLI